MELKHIFVDEDTQEGLHSICLTKGGESEYDLLMDRLKNPIYIRRYCKQNIKYLHSGFYGNITLEQAINEIRQEVWKIIELLGKSSLSSIFKPLINTEYRISALQKSKGKLTGKEFSKSKVRIYAIRIDENTFVITGGAIKLTHEMKDHPDTEGERKKIDLVRDWLKSKNLTTVDDLIYYYDEQ